MSNGQGEVQAAVGKQPNTYGNITKAKSASMQRLQKELSEISKHPTPNCSVKLKSEVDLFKWVVTIQGPKGSVYEGGVFNLEIQFANQHPFKPPKVLFRTKIYHCNLELNRPIPLDMLKDVQWSPAFTASKLLLAICSLLENCDPTEDSPIVLAPKIAFQFRMNRKEHDRVARDWTQRFAF